MPALPHNSATSWGCWAVTSGHRRPSAFPQWTGQRALGHNTAVGTLHGLLGEKNNPVTQRRKTTMPELWNDFTKTSPAPLKGADSRRGHTAVWASSSGHGRLGRSTATLAPQAHLRKTKPKPKADKNSPKIFIVNNNKKSTDAVRLLGPLSISQLTKTEEI